MIKRNFLTLIGSIFLFIITIVFTVGCNVQFVKIESIDVLNVPDEGIYVGKFDEAKITLGITYSNGNYEEVFLTENDLTDEYKNMISNPGEYKIDILYKGFNVKFDLTVLLEQVKVQFLNANSEVVKEYFAIIKDEKLELEYPTDEEMYVEGYHFTGQYEDYTIEIGKTIEINGIYKNIYTVNFYNNLDELITSQSVIEGENACLPSLEEMYVEGYLFTGEYSKSVENVVQNIDVYGIYEKVFTVKFYNGLGELISEQIVIEGQSAEEPNNKELEGYLWKAWDCDFTVVTSDLNIYGVYVKVNLFEFVSNDTTKGKIESNIENGSLIPVGTEIKLIAKPEENYIFKGWYLNNELVSTDVEYTFISNGVEIKLEGKFIFACEEGHSESDWIVDEEATCSKKGSQHKECLVCKEILESMEIDQLEHVYENGECVNCGDKINIKVTSTKNEIFSEENLYVEITFYAQIPTFVSNISSVILTSVNDSKTYYMYDDGKYANNGDDFPNDNKYTIKLNLYLCTSTTYEFFVTVNAADNIKSDSIYIKVVSTITDDEIEDMNQVDDYIHNGIFEDEKYDEYTIEEKQTIVQEQLTELVEQELVADDTIAFDEESQTYTFVYSSGILGAISLKDWKYDQNTPSYIPNILSNSSGETDLIVLWSFDQLWDIESHRKPFYEQANTEWNNAGINSNVNWSTTVADYKALSLYEIILISAHGAYYSYKLPDGSQTLKLPGIILSEEVSEQKDQLYASDLKMHRVAKINLVGGTKYVILPSFFEFYYGNNGLDGSFVVSETAEFMGVTNEESNLMSDVLLNSAVESVVGFANDVLANYSRSFAKTYIDALISGYTSLEAFEYAKQVCGENDYIEGREQYGETAYPVFNGVDMPLVNTSLQNGSFEDSVYFSGWEYSGDVRIINKLAELVPTHQNNMAILTTGIGSGESGYLGSTEGSGLQQKFNVGNSSTLTFSYDVVSEEPYEYVGSMYDDKFIVQIIDENGAIYTIVQETINTSTWYSISNIDFQGGDITTYHTKWQDISFDITQFQGQEITLKFIVYDVGDSAYDTAAIVDNICVS